MAEPLSTPAAMKSIQPASAETALTRSPNRPRSASSSASGRRSRLQTRTFRMRSSPAAAAGSGAVRSGK